MERKTRAKRSECIENLLKYLNKIEFSYCFVTLLSFVTDVNCCGMTETLGAQRRVFYSAGWIKRTFLMWISKYLVLLATTVLNIDNQ